MALNHELEMPLRLGFLQLGFAKCTDWQLEPSESQKNTGTPVPSLMSFSLLVIPFRNLELSWLLRDQSLCVHTEHAEEKE
jgi:hypothetical protein